MLEVGEEHLDLLAPMPAALIVRRLCDCTCDISAIPVEIAWDFAACCIRAADRFCGANHAIFLACAISAKAILVHARPRRRISRPVLHKLLPFRTDVAVTLSIPGEVLPRSGTIRAQGLVEDRDVGGDLLLFHQPSKVRG